MYYFAPDILKVSARRFTTGKPTVNAPIANRCEPEKIMKQYESKQKFVI